MKTILEVMGAWPKLPEWKAIIAVSGDENEYNRLRAEADNKLAKLCAHAYYERLLTIVEVLGAMHLEVACACDACSVCNARLLQTWLKKELAL